MQLLDNQAVVSEQELFPQSVELEPSDYMIMQSMSDGLEDMGFDIRSFGNNTLIYYSFPVGLEDTNAQALTEDILNVMRNDYDKEWNMRERIALSLARTNAVKHGRAFSNAEMQHLVDKLFACSFPNVSAEGKPVLSIISMDELEEKLLK
jgi:DNA mismatch repair protein MutL